MIRVQLPQHLRTLANVDSEVQLDVGQPATVGAVIAALEARYPMLTGTVRDHYTQKRRPWLRFFACQEDISHEGLDYLLPDPIVRGEEPLMVVGAIAGG